MLRAATTRPICPPCVKTVSRLSMASSSVNGAVSWQGVMLTIPISLQFAGSHQGIVCKTSCDDISADVKTCAMYASTSSEVHESIGHGCDVYQSYKLCEITDLCKCSAVQATSKKADAEVRNLFRNNQTITVLRTQGMVNCRLQPDSHRQHQSLPEDGTTHIIRCH